MKRADRRLLVHAGRTKTGTSAVQKFLFSELNDPNFEYIDLGIANQSIIINRCFRAKWSPSNTPPTESQALKSVSRAQERLVRAVESASKNNVILSAESISLLEEEEFVSFLRFFSSYFSTIHLHAYFRTPKSDMESAFTERLKWKLASCHEKVSFKHKRRFEIFEKHLGRSNIFYHRFAPADFPAGDVVTHFCNELGIANLKPEKLIVNRRLSLSAVKLLYIYRRYYPDYEAVDLTLLGRMLDIGGQHFYYHSELFKQYFDDPLQSFRWLEQRTGKSFAEDIEKNDDVGISAEADLFELDEHSRKWLGGLFSELDIEKNVNIERFDVLAAALRECAVRLNRQHRG